MGYSKEVLILLEKLNSVPTSEHIWCKHCSVLKEIFFVLEDLHNDGVLKLTERSSSELNHCKRCLLEYLKTRTIVFQELQKVCTPESVEKFKSVILKNDYTRMSKALTLNPRSNITYLEILESPEVYRYFDFENEDTLDLIHRSLDLSPSRSVNPGTLWLCTLKESKIQKLALQNSQQFHMISSTDMKRYATVVVHITRCLKSTDNTIFLCKYDQQIWAILLLFLRLLPDNFDDLGWINEWSDLIEQVLLGMQHLSDTALKLNIFTHFFLKFKSIWWFYSSMTHNEFFINILKPLLNIMDGSELSAEVIPVYIQTLQYLNDHELSDIVYNLLDCLFQIVKTKLTGTETCSIIFEVSKVYDITPYLLRSDEELFDHLLAYSLSINFKYESEALQIIDKYCKSKIYRFKKECIDAQRSTFSKSTPTQTLGFLMKVMASNPTLFAPTILSSFRYLGYLLPLYYNRTSNFYSTELEKYIHYFTIFLETQFSSMFAQAQARNIFALLVCPDKYLRDCLAASVGTLDTYEIIKSYATYDEFFDGAVESVASILRIFVDYDLFSLRLLLLCIQGILNFIAPHSYGKRNNFITSSWIMCFSIINSDIELNVELYHLLCENIIVILTSFQSMETISNQIKSYKKWLPKLLTRQNLDTNAKNIVNLVIEWHRKNQLQISKDLLDLQTKSSSEAKIRTVDLLRKAMSADTSKPIKPETKQLFQNLDQSWRSESRRLVNSIRLSYDPNKNKQQTTTSNSPGKLEKKSDYPINNIKSRLPTRRKLGHIDESEDLKLEIKSVSEKKSKDLQKLREIQSKGRKESKEVEVVSLPGMQSDALYKKVLSEKKMQMKIISTIEDLHKMVMECNMFATNLGNSIKVNEDVQVIPLLFKNENEYISVFEPLLLEELRAQLEKTRYETEEESFDSTVLSVSRVNITHNINLKLESGRYKENDVLLISTSDKIKLPTDCHALAIVMKNDQTEKKIKNICKIKVSLNGGDRERIKKMSDKLLIGAKWKVQRIFNLSTVTREWRALQLCSNIQLLPNILRPRLIQPYSNIRQSILLKELSNVYNNSQMEAISRSIERGFSLIQGPPGTGKTSTIIGIISYLLEENEGPILLCAPSNGAVDELTTRLIKQGVYGFKQSGSLRTWSPIIVRVGILNEDSPSELKDVSVYLGSKNESNGDYKKEMARFGSADIVCATLSSSGLPIFDKISKNFKSVIIDEAAQATELSTLIPLKQNTRCIMVGDPQQLPATVISQKASMFNFEQSMFERFKRNNVHSVLLSSQYRMHSDIRKFPSKYFYDDKLTDGITRLPQEWHSSFHFGPYLFFDIKSHISYSNLSMYNEKEADFVLNHIKRLVRSYKTHDFSGKIGIITPYKKQRNILMSRIAKDNTLENILCSNDVKTIDGFQGKEKDIIIFTTVRSHEQKSIGFLSDLRRINVALTRARHSLWIVGNAEALGKNKCWQALIDDSKDRGLFIDALNMD